MVKIFIIIAATAEAILTFLLVLLLTIYIKRSRSTDLFHRLRRHNVEDNVREFEPENFYQKSYQYIKRIAKPFISWNIAQRIELKLKQAGLPLLGAEFILIALISAFLAGIFAYMLTLDKILSAIIGGLVIIALSLAISILIDRRREAFTEQLGDCLTTVANALRAGYSFQQAMSVIANEMEPPISEEFAVVTNDIARGLPLKDALERMNERVGSSDFDLVVTAVLIQREVGGNLAQILDTISDTINDRIRMKREILTLTAQGRFSAIILFLLPFAAGAYMYFVNHDNFMLLFEEPVGQIAIIASFVMAIIGFIVIRKIVDIDV